jgi:hypothetical protein
MATGALAGESSVSEMECIHGVQIPRCPEYVEQVNCVFEIMFPWSSPRFRSKREGGLFDFHLEVTSDIPEEGRIPWETSVRDSAKHSDLLCNLLIKGRKVW